MPKNIQIRNVPNDIHKELTDRAAVAGEKAGRRLNGDLSHQAPQLVKAEALSGLSKLVASGDVTRDRAATVLARIERLRIETSPIEGFIGRIWGLRGNLSVYDAWYVALAEAPQVTTDGRLQRALGVECEVELTN